jgi:hypothetical protein
MSRKRIDGICKLCGNYGQLSFEHVPPEKAFNDQRFSYQATVDQIEKLEEKDPSYYTGQSLSMKGWRKKQGGIGYHSLCVKCNSSTGSWYGSSYVDWAMQAMSILLKANGKPTLFYPTHIYPLRVIKQIITMFFSVCHNLREDEPELVKFVLDSNDRFLSSKYKIYCYYNLSEGVRYMGDNFIGNLKHSSVIHASEISFTPFGFVFTINSEKPDNRLTNISHFAWSEYNHWTDFYQRFNVLPVYLPYAPLDYRTGDEIASAIQKSVDSRKVIT